jgi:hypothetical protein
VGGQFRVDSHHTEASKVREALSTTLAHQLFITEAQWLSGCLKFKGPRVCLAHEGRVKGRTGYGSYIGVVGGHEEHALVRHAELLQLETLLPHTTTTREVVIFRHIGHIKRWAW